MVELASLGALGLVMLIGPFRLAGRRLSLSTPAVASVGVAAVVLLLLFRPAQGPHVVIAAASSVAVSWLLRRRRQRAAARTTSLAVQLACAELADDLRMGLVPEAAIVSAGARWPPLRPVVVAAQLHDDVAHALREVANRPGAAGLRSVAAAWEVSGHAGSGLAEALDQVAHLLSADERRARLVDAELAAARATAMIVSGLPLLVLGMGSGLGTNPWPFFLSGLGVVDLGLASALLIAGWVWLDWLAARAVVG